MIKYLKTDDAKCVGCMSCAEACSTAFFKEDNPAKSSIQALDLGDGAYRLVACDQDCRKCVAECPTRALTVAKNGVVLIDRALCVGCLACVAICPSGAMRYYPGIGLPFKCVACGLCVKACPKGALALAEKEEPVPADGPSRVSGEGV